MRVNILNVPFDNVTLPEALEQLLAFLAQDAYHILCTPNPEMVMAANADAAFMHVLQHADLVVPDGIGVVLASRLSRRRGLKERVAGCDLVFALLDRIKATGKTVYLLGGKPGVAAQAAANMRARFPGLCIAGHHNGYFNDNDAEECALLDEITRLAPDVLLVGLGAGRQEKWIYRNRALPVKLAAGVGGSLDVMAGTVKRAPAGFRRFGLEWLYRLLTQPSRWRRMLCLPVFAVRVLTEKKKGSRST